jgi:hypothetical protein
MYRVSAELSGFKKLNRENVEVRVGDRITLDLSLEVGQMEETVSVTAESPLLELGNASAGQVIDERRISAAAVGRQPVPARTDGAGCCLHG